MSAPAAPRAGDGNASPASARRFGSGARPSKDPPDGVEVADLGEVAEEAVTRSSMERCVGRLSDEIKGHLDSTMQEVQRTVQDEAAVLLDSLEGSFKQQLEAAVSDLRELSRTTLQEIRESIKVDAARSEAKVVQAIHAVEAQGVAWSALASESRRSFAELDRKLTLSAELDRKPDFDRKLASESAKSRDDDRSEGDPARSVAASSEVKSEEPGTAPAKPSGGGLKGMMALKRGLKSGEVGRIVDEMEAPARHLVQSRAGSRARFADGDDLQAMTAAEQEGITALVSEVQMEARKDADLDWKERFLPQLEQSSAACEMLLQERVLPQLEAQQRQLADLAASSQWAAGVLVELAASRGPSSQAGGAAAEGAGAGEGKAAWAETLVAIQETTRSVCTEVRCLRGDAGTPATLSSVQAHCCHIVDSAGRVEAATGRLEASGGVLREQLEDALSRLRRIDGRLGQLTSPDASAAAVAAGAAASVAGANLSERVGDVVLRLRRLDAEQRQVRQAVEELGRHFVFMFGPRPQDSLHREGPALTPLKPTRRSRPASAAAAGPRALGR